MFECAHCQYRTEFKNNMRKHLLARHVPKPRKPNAKVVRCALCEFESYTRPDVVKHYNDVHHIKCEVKQISFDSMASFELWKEEFETEVKANYVARRGSRSRGNTSYQTLYCHRDGCYEAKGRGKRNLKKVGSVKIDRCCPSQINVKSCLATGKVTVKFISDHAGHGNDVERLHIRRAEKKRLAERLAAGETFDRIISNVRETIVSNDCLERIHLITRQDLANTVRDFKLNRDVLRRQGIASKVESCISEMVKSGNTVRFYKPQGVYLPENPSLSMTDFVLIFANDDQIELLKDYGSDLIWFEGINGPNRDCFKLTTLLTVDDTEKGIPCCFMLSNRWDTFIVTLMTGVLMNAVGGVIQTTTFMSDMDDNYYNGWCTVMPAPTFRLFCSWHVDNTWEENLQQHVQDEDEATVVFKRLKGIQFHPNENSFRKLLEAEIARLRSHSSTESFGEYFETDFSTNYRCWAHCYRTYCPVHTNAFLASMPDTLFQVYIDGKKNRRLDAAIAALIKYVQDLHLLKVISLNEASTNKKLASIQKRHFRAIEDERVLDCVARTNLGWSVASEDSEEAHEVVLNTQSCDCDLKCEMCECCIHSYRCNCLDCAIKWNMCKHIHMVALYLQRQPYTVIVADSADTREEAYEEDGQLSEESRSEEVTGIKVEVAMDTDDSSEEMFDETAETVMVNEERVEEDYVEVVEVGEEEVLEGGEEEVLEDEVEEVLEDAVEELLEDEVEELLEDEVEEALEDEAEEIIEGNGVTYLLQSYDEMTSDNEPEATIIFDDLSTDIDIDANQQTTKQKLDELYARIRSEVKSLDDLDGEVKMLKSQP